MGKVVIIGLDGGNFDIIQKWKDKLPTLKKFIDHGSSGYLKTTIPPLTIPAWPSFYTGKNPGKYGVFDFVDRTSKNKNKIVDSTYVKSDSLWSILSKDNKKCCVINVPLTYPAKKINGLMITGLLTPKRDSFFTYPKQLSEKIKDYRLHLDVGYTKKKKKEFFNDAVKVHRARAKTSIDLVKSQYFDFFMVVFTMTDEISHHYWKDMVKKTKYEKAIFRIYREADNSIKKLMDTAGKDTNFIIMSDHGFGSLEKMVNLNLFLIDKKLLFLKKEILTNLKYNLFKLGFTPTNIYNLVCKLGLQDFFPEPRINKNVREKLLNIFLSFSDVDWNRTIAYSLGNVGQIHLNKKDIHYKKKVIKSLYNLKENNESIIDEIYEKKDLYSGKYFEYATDLCLKMKDFSYISYPVFVNSNKIIDNHPLGISGGHRLHGVFLAYGPDIKFNNVKNAEIIDITPTVLHMFNQEIPPDMDGKVLKEIFKENSDFLKNKIKYEKIDKTNLEKQKINKTLKKLRLL
ncbi:hypothetical protein GF327_03955 [Candidatus Woesearchaeota archaeon]|nr:hypothetical protein [Candidatus Woesearchaeota archaeon]